MSKTVEDLKQVYIDALCASDGAISAGIAAVVTALRDELVREFERCDCCSGIEHVEPFFEEILAPREGGSREAGVPTSDGGTELDRTSGPAPAAPAPDKNWAGALQWEADEGRDDRSGRRRHMSDELIIVKAARNYADDIDNDRGIEMGLPDCLREAANLIERLTAQVDGLQDEIKRLREQVRFASETDPAMRAEAAEAEAARLKGALEALAGERDKTRADYEAMKAHNKELFGKLSDAETERGRLKAALQPIKFTEAK